MGEDGFTEIALLAPNVLVGITSLHPAAAPVPAQLSLLTSLAADSVIWPDLMSVNLGHITVWERSATITG